VKSGNEDGQIVANREPLLNLVEIEGGRLSDKIE
jgi:hypothetical protein